MYGDSSSPGPIDSMDLDGAAKDVSGHMIQASIVHQHATARRMQPTGRADSGGFRIRPLKNTQILPAMPLRGLNFCQTPSIPIRLC